MMKYLPLYQWPGQLKLLVITFVIVLSIGVTTGLIYVGLTTGMNPVGTSEHYSGSEAPDDFDIPEKYPQSLEHMLLTTHTHIISFAIIFIFLGGLFYFTSILGDGWKIFFMIEPLISTLVTFGSIWGIRYIHSGFSFVTMVSGILMYTSFYFMVSIIAWEITFKKEANSSGLKG